MAHDRRSRDAPDVVESHREPGNGRFVLFGKVVSHDGRRLVANVFELRHHRLHPALVAFSRLFEKSENIDVLGVVGTIPWVNVSAFSRRIYQVTRLGWAIPSQVWSGTVLSTNSKTPA